MPKEEEDPDEICDMFPVSITIKEIKSAYKNQLEYINYFKDNWKYLNIYEIIRFTIIKNRFKDCETYDEAHKINCIIYKELKRIRNVVETNKKILNKVFNNKKYVAKDGSKLYTLHEVIEYNKAMGYVSKEENENITNKNPYYDDLDKVKRRNRR